MHCKFIHTGADPEVDDREGRLGGGGGGGGAQGGD